MLRENLTTWRFDAKSKNLTVMVRVQKVEPDAIHQPGALYAVAYNPYKEKYGKKIVQVENYSEIIGAELYGIASSMGFVLDIQDGSRRSVVAWQSFADAGWHYETLVTSPADQSPELFRIIESFHFVDPATKAPRAAMIGDTGLSTIYGAGFEQKELNPSAEEMALYSKIEQFDLKSPRLSIVASAQAVTFRDASAVDVESYIARIQGVVGQVMKGGKLESTLESTTIDGKPGHRLTGTISDSRLKIEVEGRIVVIGDRLWSLLVFFPVPGEENKKLGEDLLRSLSLKPAP